ncbi:MAG: antitoxin family protein [Chloroflexota bacterium]|nr:antitoxin family protein [Chloroflexota bacterium]
MKHQRIPAIYEGGVLKPLEPLDLADHQTVYLSIETKGRNASVVQHATQYLATHKREDGSNR